MDFLLASFEGYETVQLVKMAVMIAIGGLLIFLAIRFKMEPALLLPLGFGAILVNLPLSGVIDQTMAGMNEPTKGIIQWLFEVGIEASEMLPLLLFIGIGAMIDFGPLLANPKLLFFGAAAQIGIFITMIFAALLSNVGNGFTLADIASIGIIGAADGPTAILVSQVLNSKFTGAIMVAAYCYMALVPVIQPAVTKICTTKKERMIKMPYKPATISKSAKILFPILVTVIAGLVAPASVSLVGFLMFGNLLRECGVLGSLSETASKVLANLVTLLLGITVSFTMQAEAFLTWDTAMIMGLGLFAFVFDMVGGIMLAKLFNLFSRKNKINPMIGAAGISAFPMSARIVQKLGLEADPTNHLLMPAVAANVSGQIASVLAGGILLSLVPGMML